MLSASRAGAVRTSVALLAVLSTGCVDATNWSTPSYSPYTVLSRTPIPAGTEVSVETTTSELRFKELSLCRFREQRTREATATRDVTTGSGWHGLGTFLVVTGATVGVAGIIASAVVAAEDRSSPGANAAAVVGTLGFAHGLPLTIVFPRHRVEERTTKEDDEHFTRALDQCPDSPPAAAPVQAFAIEVSAPGTNAVELKEKADNNGRYRGVLVDELRDLAGWCPNMKARVVLDLPRTDPSVTRITRSWSGPARLAFDTTIPRVPLSSFGRSSLGDMARQCCKDAARRTHEGPCERRCATAGDAAPCVNAREACRMKAARSENEDDNRRLCENLFDECLVARGTSHENLQSCTGLCVDQNTACK